MTEDSGVCVAEWQNVAGRGAAFFSKATTMRSDQIKGKRAYENSNVQSRYGSGRNCSTMK